MLLRSDGRVQGWGLNSQGQLGIGSTTNLGTPGTSIIDQVIALGDKTVIQIEALSDAACAVFDDGTVTCWGDSPTHFLDSQFATDIGDGETPATPSHACIITLCSFSRSRGSLLPSRFAT